MNIEGDVVVVAAVVTGDFALLSVAGVAVAAASLSISFFSVSLLIYQQWQFLWMLILLTTL